MNTEQRQALMKIFSGLLRTKSKEEQLSAAPIDPSLSKFLSRKELLFILDLKFKGKFPKEFNLAEMENEELLLLIEDGFVVLAYFLELWIQEAVAEKPKSSAKETMDTKKLNASDSNKETQKTKEVSKIDQISKSKQSKETANQKTPLSVKKGGKP